VIGRGGWPGDLPLGRGRAGRDAGTSRSSAPARPGAAALGALRARPDARVLLLDRADFPRDKSCGDGIAPHALDELARLGAADVLADRVPSAGCACAPRTASRSHAAARPTRRAAHALRRAAGRGRRRPRRRAARHTVRRLEVRPDGVVLDGRCTRGRSSGADGANGVVRRSSARRAAGRRAWPSRCAATRSRPPGEPEQRIVMDRRGLAGVRLVVRRGDGTRNVGFGMLLPRLRASARGGRAELHGRLPSCCRASRPSAWSATTCRCRRGARRRPRPVLLAGDALSLINPLTGEGIYYALLSGSPRRRRRGATGAPGPGVRRRAAARRSRATCGTPRCWPG
jgi:2-polyprenyl-6-methoxyphenol hydroxylase-like FAD-dependent oxidoreductase